MANDERVNFPLSYGRTDGTNIPKMTLNKLYCAGYNTKYGLINVHEDNGDEFFKGRVNIEDLLKQIQGQPKPVIDNIVLDSIISSYCKRFKIPYDYQNKDIQPLEVLTDRRDIK